MLQSFGGNNLGMSGAGMGAGAGSLSYMPDNPWQNTYAGQKMGQDSAEKIAAGQQAAGIKEAQIGANASMYPATLKQQRFGEVFPWLQGQMGGLGGAWGAAFGPGNSSGGQVGNQPTIKAGPVWTQDQIQQQINGQAAQNDAKTGGQIRDIGQSAAGRGFGSNSPLAQALGVMAQGQNNATNANMAQQTQWNAAQGNAQALLQGQQAQEQQFASRQQEDIERHKVIAGRQNALLAALAGMV